MFTTLQEKYRNRKINKMSEHPFFSNKLNEIQIEFVPNNPHTSSRAWTILFNNVPRIILTEASLYFDENHHLCIEGVDVKTNIKHIQIIEKNDIKWNALSTKDILSINEDGFYSKPNEFMIDVILKNNDSYLLICKH